MKTPFLPLAATLLALSAPAARAEPPAPPEDAKKVLAELEKDVKAIEGKVRKEVRDRQEKALKQLQDLQDSYTKAAKLDEALAVRGVLKPLKDELQVLALGGSVLADPGTLTAHRGKTDEVFYIRVTGSTDGQVWGSVVYTDDSPLATAAVHAGLVKKGETAILKVTILAGQAGYTGSTDNDVTTADYGDFDGSYKIEAVPEKK